MRPLRTLAVLLACLAAIAVAAGCGGDDDSSSGLGGALAYVPAETPFVVAIDTDLEGDQYKSLDAILNRFPGADTIKALLKSQLSLGQEVPEAMWTAVAEVLAWAYGLSGGPPTPNR